MNPYGPERMLFFQGVTPYMCMCPGPNQKLAVKLLRVTEEVLAEDQGLRPAFREHRSVPSLQCLLSDCGVNLGVDFELNHQKSF